MKLDSDDFELFDLPRRYALDRAALGTLIDDAHDCAAAAAQVRALMFVERFAESIDQRLEALGQ